MELTPAAAAFVSAARVGRLATVNAAGQPHCVPVVFVLDAGDVVIPIDRKPKRVPPEGLARVRNLAANPAVAFLVDHYAEDWSQLRFMQAFGRGHYEADVPARLLEVLAAKYEQYRSMPIDGLIRIEIERWSGWSAH